MPVLVAILLLTIELVALTFEKFCHKSPIVRTQVWNCDVKEVHLDQFLFLISAQSLIRRIRGLEASVEGGKGDADCGILKHSLPSALAYPTFCDVAQVAGETR